MASKEADKTFHLSRKQGWLVALAVALIGCIFAVSLVGVHRLHNYTSDDVSLQALLLERGKYGHIDAQFSVDSYITRWPLYVLVQHLMQPSRHALLVITMSLNALLFAGVVAAVFFAWREFLWKQTKQTPLLWASGLLALWWVFSLGQSFALALLNPNVRNVEIGVCLLLAVLTVRFAQRERFSWWVLGGLGAFIGLFIYDDPYFLFTLFASLALVPVYYFLRDADDSRRVGHAWRIYGVLVVALLASKIAKIAFAAMGFHAYPSINAFAELSTIGLNLVHTLDSLLWIFHANFFGQAARPGLITTLMNALVLFVLLGLMVRACLKRQLREPWQVLAVLSIAVLLLVYGLTTNSDVDTIRYLILAPFALLLLVPSLVASVQTKRLQNVLIALLTAAALLNTVAIVRDLRTAPIGESHNARTTHIISVLRANHLSKGYGWYWDGNITTYLSAGKQLTLPVVCGPHGLQIYYWLMDAAWVHKPATQTYLIVNKQADVFAQCNDTLLARQFGDPAQKITLDTQATLYIYDYDIYSRMPQQHQPSNQP